MAKVKAPKTIKDVRALTTKAWKKASELQDILVVLHTKAYPIMEEIEEENAGIIDAGFEDLWVNNATTVQHLAQDEDTLCYLVEMEEYGDDDDY